MAGRHLERSFSRVIFKLGPLDLIREHTRVCVRVCVCVGVCVCVCVEGSLQALEKNGVGLDLIFYHFCTLESHV